MNLGEWIVTRTPDDPSADLLWIGRARDALHAFDQYAVAEGFGPYSDLIDPRSDIPYYTDEERAGWVVQDAEGRPWAIMTNFSVTAVLGRSGEQIAEGAWAESFQDGYALGDPKVQTLMNQEVGGI